MFQKKVQFSIGSIDFNVLLCYGYYVLRHLPLQPFGGKETMQAASVASRPLSTHQKIELLLHSFNERYGGKLLFCSARHRHEGHTTSAQAILWGGGLKFLYVEFSILRNPSSGLTFTSIKKVLSTIPNPFNSGGRWFRWQKDHPRGTYDQSFKSMLEDSLVGGHRVIERMELPWWKRWLHHW